MQYLNFDFYVTKSFGSVSRSTAIEDIKMSEFVYGGFLKFSFHILDIKVVLSHQINVLFSYVKRQIIR